MDAAEVLAGCRSGGSRRLTSANNLGGGVILSHSSHIHGLCLWQALDDWGWQGEPEGEATSTASYVGTTAGDGFSGVPSSVDRKAGLWWWCLLWGTRSQWPLEEMKVWRWAWQRSTGGSIRASAQGVKRTRKRQAYSNHPIRVVGVVSSYGMQAIGGYVAALACSGGQRGHSGLGTMPHEFHWKT